eukprot:490950_1
MLRLLLLLMLTAAQDSCDSFNTTDIDIEWISYTVRNIAISFKALTSRQILQSDTLESTDYAPPLLVQMITKNIKQKLTAADNKYSSKLNSMKQLKQNAKTLLTIIYNKLSSTCIQSTNIIHIRYDWMRAILKSIVTKLNQIINRKTLSFDEESEKLYDVKIPDSYIDQRTIDTYFNQLMFILNITQQQHKNDPTIVYEQYSKFRNQFQISDDHYQIVFTYILNDVKNMFKSKLSNSCTTLIESSILKEIYFNDKSNSAEAYCSYKGNMQSSMHMNIARKITIEKCQQLTTHELTHHIHYVIMESIRRKYPEFQVQMHGSLSFVMESCAELAVDLIWNKYDRIQYLKHKILPLMNIKTQSNAQIETLIEMDTIVTKLWRLYTLIAKQLISNKISEINAVWKMKYIGMKARISWPNVDFFKSHKAYITGYGFGKLLIKQYLEQRGNCIENNSNYYDCMWLQFEQFLLIPITPNHMQTILHDEF